MFRKTVLIRAESQNYVVRRDEQMSYQEGMRFLIPPKHQLCKLNFFSHCFPCRLLPEVCFYNNTGKDGSLVTVEVCNYFSFMLTLEIYQPHQ